jgi:hypothetical protein
MFDPEMFLNSEVTKPMSTTRPAMSEMETQGYVKKMQFKNPKDDLIVLELFWVADSEQARQETGMEEPTVKQSLWIDLNDDGFLDTGEGKNVDLGKVRKAVGQNGEGAWSPAMLEGATATLFIIQDPGKDGDDNIYNRVKSVSPAE